MQEINLKKKGSQIIVESLIKENVEYMFGYPGGVVIPIFHELYHAPIKFILSRHEQGAIHAADGYARASGKPGVVLATSGPGATNLITGIATAHLDSVPLVVFTGQVSTNMIGNDAFQEVDVTGITRPISKHNYLVQDIKDLARIIKEAFYIATTGRPGPVVIDVPVDISNGMHKFEYPESISMRSYKPTYEGHPGQIVKACKLIESSSRPVIYAGGGVIISEASEELREFAKKTGIPVTTTLLGMGAYPETDPLSLEMLGMHGTYFANYAVHHSDLLIAIGARFDDRVTGKISEFIPHAKVIHIDIDPASVSKNVLVDVPIVGDCKKVLKEMIKEVKAPSIDEWVSEVKKVKKENPLQYEDSTEEIKPQYVIEQLYKETKGKAVITTEVGQNQMWAAQFYKYTEPRTFISSGGLGTMGFGLPAAIGAQFARPDRRVIDIAGDGSIQMNVQELIVAAQHRLPIIVAILNNGFLGMVRQWQQLFWDKRYSHTCINYAPDFVKLAEAYNCEGIRVTKKEDVIPAIKKALKITDKPIIIDFVVSKEENVYPMVPAGKTIKDTIMNELA
ncbi:MAG TPA: biosynthetic-type acetolactate synthase large subunit [Spirochaetota bacterium]|nr:biosynthetic-type acetolactate synthase large subunit [Spirochaetota bacterium]HPF05347.1 biosynthetic-type acetolactate synthase large subunit [Spirochaetota bacterium]HPJ41777.1 biosynthetic-type acetolactate synthase large subunit [Spirochaetota bacterium]HPR39167.1 biosynthetic-type acetolactate synthase large subunit [Spirochaetota bacterium]HRX46983.1 biosynthetic-type acetolactate synthase large subunit [Spirochaetota bacterium]